VILLLTVFLVNGTIPRRFRIGNEKLSESPIITFIRGITLLAILIALPGIAICWNHLPKDLWSESTPSAVSPKVEKTQYFQQNSIESARSISAFVPEATYSALPDVPVLSDMPVAGVAVQNPPIQSHWTQSHWTPPNMAIQPNTAIQQVSWEQHPSTASPQDFESLGLRLEALGATYYKLEKWGNRGELFRFSCFVALSENHAHTKHFQAIGSDVVTVMQTVIADIERWRNMR